MRSIITEGSRSALPMPTIGPQSRLDRVTVSTFGQLRTSLIFLSAFSQDVFDFAMDAAESEDDDPGPTGEAEPVCAACGGSIGIFLDLGVLTGGTSPATAPRPTSNRSTTQAKLRW
jgi:hypothetical protein